MSVERRNAIDKVAAELNLSRGQLLAIAREAVENAAIAHCDNLSADGYFALWFALELISRPAAELAA